MGGYSNCCCSDSTSTSEEICPLNEFSFNLEPDGPAPFNAWYGAGAVDINVADADWGSLTDQKFARAYSTSTTSPTRTAVNIKSLRTSLGSDIGNGAFSGWDDTKLTGDTHPAPFFFNDGIGYEGTSGSVPYSIPSPNFYLVASAIYTDFIWFGQKEIIFDWCFLTNERTYSPFSSPIDDKVDFGFVSIQRQTDAEPTVVRLADTFSELLLYGPVSMNGGSNGVSTGRREYSIMLPGPSTEAVFRIAFGCCNVFDKTQTSALTVSNLRCWEGSSSSSGS